MIAIMDGLPFKFDKVFYCEEDYSYRGILYIPVDNNGISMGRLTIDCILNTNKDKCLGYTLELKLYGKKFEKTITYKTGKDWNDIRLAMIDVVMSFNTLFGTSYTLEDKDIK